MKHYLLLFLIIAVIRIPSRGQSEGASRPFKIVGYYALQSAMTEPPPAELFRRLTHLNLWFLNPDTTGVFSPSYGALDSFVSAAHRQNVQVLASIGGGSPHPYYHTLLQEAHRARFIANLLAVVDRYGLDGVDVDLEGGDMGPDYEAFVVDLAAALRARKKSITAAVAVYYKDALSDRALAQFDFINIMSYDRTGPWRPERGGPHSLLAHAAEDLEYFGVQRSVPKEKMVLGVPFYGYGFGPGPSDAAISLNYGQIIAQYPGAEGTDELRLPDGKMLYYNGRETIRRKTALAQEKASGIMIWQVRGDAPGKASLLSAIYEAVHGKEPGR